MPLSIYFSFFTQYFFAVRIPACIEAHLRRINPEGNYQIPNTSPLQPISTPFSQHHLQCGLDNTSNCCGLISIILCFHRLGLINQLIVPSQMRSVIGSSDYACGVLAKILLAAPCQNAYAIQTFIDTWNASRLGLELDQNEDLFIIEGILRRLQFQDQGGIPTLTQYKASFYCPRCQLQYRGITEWENPAFTSVPELQLPDQLNAVHPSDLFTGLMNETFPITCQVCQTQINDACYQIVKGKVTIVRLNRVGFRDGNVYKIMTPLDHGRNSSPGSEYLGELVAVICNRGEGTRHTHWVSYSKTTNGWFINDDHRPPAPSSPLNSRVIGETINLLCYKN